MLALPYHNTSIRHWNPGLTRPLILPVHLICNTSDDEIFSNIWVNSRRPGQWLTSSEPHNKIAVLCGSGPSLADTLSDIRQWQDVGATIYAMNGAANYLTNNGILPDYQVIIDAREQTADLVGQAREHLFASQVHPGCFEKMPTAKLWHLQVEGIDGQLPSYENAYCLIGGAASVGNTATCLAYAMGYRMLHCYGYDSSHRNTNGHAFHQPMNDGDPCAVIDFNGKQYIASLTMKLQAEKFMETSRALKIGGCEIQVHGSGLLPDLYNAPPMSEEEKYRKVWERDEYRTFAPGENCAKVFAEMFQPDGTVIDFGCGTGRGALYLKNNGFPVMLADFADNCRDKEAEELPFVKCDLRETMKLVAKYGFCTDVMEHIEPQHVRTVITNIMDCVETGFFQISTVPDNLGVLIGQQLHLTVKSPEWWRKMFTGLGYQVTWQQDTSVSTMLIINGDNHA